MAATFGSAIWFFGDVLNCFSYLRPIFAPLFSCAAVTFGSAVGCFKGGSPTRFHLPLSLPIVPHTVTFGSAVGCFKGTEKIMKLGDVRSVLVDEASQVRGFTAFFPLN